MKIKKKGNVYKKKNFFDNLADKWVDILFWFLAIGVVIALLLEVGR